MTWLSHYVIQMRPKILLFGSETAQYSTARALTLASACAGPVSRDPVSFTIPGPVTGDRDTKAVT